MIHKPDEIILYNDYENFPALKVEWSRSIDALVSMNLFFVYY